MRFIAIASSVIGVALVAVAPAASAAQQGIFAGGSVDVPAAAISQVISGLPSGSRVVVSRSTSRSEGFRPLAAKFAARGISLTLDDDVAQGNWVAVRVSR